MTQTKDQSITETDYSKPHAFELEVGRITRVCKCGAPFGTELHAAHAENRGMAKLPMSPYTKHTNICLLKADDDMPLFVLKPTDALALQTIEYWYCLTLQGNTSSETRADVLNLRDAFKAWQTAHPNRVHNPD